MFKPKTDEEFITRRKTCLKFWRYTGPLMLMIIAALMVFLYFYVPWLVNPVITIDRVMTRSFDLITLETMAVMLPFLFNMMFVLLFVIVALTYVVMKNDKRYQKIIENMRKSEWAVKN